MKSLFLCLFLSFSVFNSFAQKDSIIKYSGIVVIEGATKEQLYQRARSWFNDAFKSSKDVIQIQDKETGEIAGKGIIKSSITVRMFGSHDYEAPFSFSMKVFVKDGKFKYDITNFDNYEFGTNRVSPLGVLTSSTECPVKWPGYSQKRMDEVWASAKQNIEPKVTSLISSLKKSMSAPVSDDF